MKRRDRRKSERGGPGAPPAVAPVGLLQQAIAEHRAGRLAEALAGYRRVLKQAPRHAAALNLAGAAAFHLGHEAEALRLLQAAARAAPDDPEVHNNLGNTLKARGRLREAAEAYRRALALAPDYAGAAFNLGTALLVAGEQEAAAEAFERAVALRPEDSEARIALARLRRAAGRLTEALECCESALAAWADNPGALVNKAAILQELGRCEEALDAARAAAAAAPAFPDAAYNEGVALQELGRTAEALEAYRRTLALDPGYAPALLNLGYALQQLARPEEAEAALRQAVELWPDYAQPAVNLADLLLARGATSEAVETCEVFLTRNPGDAGMLSMLALCLREAGRSEEARRLTDPEALVLARPIEAPAGYAERAAFDRDLVDHLLAHPSLVQAPASHATRDGRHSGELLTEPKGPAAGLETAIRAAVDGLLAAPPPAWVPLLGGLKPRRGRLTLWGVALEAQGRQLPHNHPAARISGVYYAALPGGLGDEGTRAGWLEFGRLPEHYHARQPAEIRALRPEQGLLVLFPSHLWHRTLPFAGAGLRVSFAFDLMLEPRRKS